MHGVQGDDGVDFIVGSILPRCDLLADCIRGLGNECTIHLDPIDFCIFAWRSGVVIPGS